MKARGLPADWPLVWHAGLVAFRVRQLWEWVYLPVPSVHAPAAALNAVRAARQAAWSPPVCAWLAELGIVRRGYPLGQVVVGDVGKYWAPGRCPMPVFATRCPRCRRSCSRLIERAEGGRWGCAKCEPKGWDRGQGWLGVAAADYAFAQRIGLQRVRLRERRADVLRQARQLGQRARTPADLVLVARAVALAGPKVGRFFRQARPEGAFWEAMKPLIVPAAIQMLLSPTAYLARFGKTRCAAVA